MKKFYFTSLILVLSAVFAYATGQQEESESQNDDGYTHILVTMEGHAGDAGTGPEAVAKTQAVIDAGGKAQNEIDEMNFKIDYLTALDTAAKEKGVEYEGLMWGWSEQLEQKQLNALMADSGPDVFVGEIQMPGFALKGYLAPFPPDLEAKVRENVIKGAYGPMEFDGKIYGVATYPGVNVLFWNKDLLRKAGLDPDKAPKTWGEWLSMAQQITDAGNGEFYGGGTYAGPNFGGSLRVGPFLMMTGGGFIDNNGDAAFNTPENIETLEFMRKLAKLSPAGLAGGPGEGGWWDAFTQGKIAYVVDGPWRLGVCEAVGIDAGYSVLPIPEDGIAANVTIGAAFYGVTEYSKNKEAAFAFIESLFDPRVQQTVKDLGYRPPVLKEYGDDAEFVDSYIGTFWKTLNGEVSGLPTFKGNQNAKIWDVFHQAMVKSIVTDDDIAEILDKAQDLAENYQQN